MFHLRSRLVCFFLYPSFSQSLGRHVEMLHDSNYYTCASKTAEYMFPKTCFFVNLLAFLMYFMTFLAKMLGNILVFLQQQEPTGKSEGFYLYTSCYKLQRVVVQAARWTVRLLQSDHYSHKVAVIITHCAELWCPSSLQTHALTQHLYYGFKCLPTRRTIGGGRGWTVQTHCSFEMNRAGSCGANAALILT